VSNNTKYFSTFASIAKQLNISKREAENLYKSGMRKIEKGLTSHNITHKDIYITSGVNNNPLDVNA
jgi:dimeric dUTPase (all-alpha-NTP-PPase superfamily)